MYLSTDVPEQLYNTFQVPLESAKLLQSLYYYSYD